MNDPEQDEARLRDAFTRLKAHDARRRPSFEELRRPPVVRPFPRAVVALVPLAAAAILLLVWGGPTSSPMASSPSSAASSAPSLADPVVVAIHSDDLTGALPLEFLLEPTFGGPRDSTAFLSRVPPLDLSKGPR